ncbi:MAG: T9SS type A sorting domain-containing protein [Bacteroidetes bacterium]|nr:T9SS type A sorting domain-containing protein [Bacteroidota bacterium]
MRTLLRLLLCTFVLVHVLFSRSKAQCLVAPPAPACTGTEQKAADGETIAAPDSKWYYGSPATYGSLTLSGGTLIVCGNLTLSQFSFNSGIVYVLPGASLTIGGSTTLQLSGGCYVYNYGTVTIQRSLSLDNAHASPVNPNVFINASTSSVLTVPFDWFVINNPYSWFVNNGTASMHGIVTDPQSAAGSVCLGAGSQTAMSTLINNAPGAYNAPSGGACVSVQDHSYLCENLTSSGSVRLCLSPSHITDSSCFVSRGHTNAWGSATLFKSCTSCAATTLLPVHFISFSASVAGRDVRLSWHIDGDTAGYRALIERSGDGIQYAPLSSAIDPGPGETYSTTDREPFAGNSYYRIAYFNAVTRTAIYSPVKALENTRASVISVYPNPFATQFSVSLPTGVVPVALGLWTTDGQQVPSLYVHNEGNGRLDVRTGQALAPGTYLLRIRTDKLIYSTELIRR